MRNQCTQCGSHNTRRSHTLKEERSLSKILLRPIHCRDCQARTWVPYKKAYVVASITFFASIALAYLIWAVVIMPTQTIERTSNNVDYLGQNQIKPRATGNPELDLSSDNTVNQKFTNQTPGGEPRNPNQQQEKPYFTIQLYQEKAREGDAEAQYQLGLLFMNGKGTIQDFEEAARWFKLAANQNHALSQYQLGLIHKTGYGLPANLEKSYMWFNISAAAGIQEAIIARDKIMLSLTPKQLKKAQEASRKWFLNTNKNLITTNKDNK